MTGNSIPFEQDATAPFSISFDSTQQPDGDYQVLTVSQDGTTNILRSDPIRIRNRPNFVVVLVDDLDETTTD